MYQYMRCDLRQDRSSPGIVLSGRGRGTLERFREKILALVIWLFYELGGGKVEVSYAYNGQCSSICDAICDRTRCAPGTAFLGGGRGTLVGSGGGAGLRVRGWQI